MKIKNLKVNNSKFVLNYKNYQSRYCTKFQKHQVILYSIIYRNNLVSGINQYLLETSSFIFHHFAYVGIFR